MQLNNSKYFQVMLAAFCLLAVPCVMAQPTSKQFNPSSVKGFSGSMSHIYLQDSVEAWLLDLFELDANQVLNQIAEKGGTTVPLSYHRLQYVDGIADEQNKSRIDVHYDLKSPKHYIKAEDLYNVGKSFRALRDDFFAPVKVPGLIRSHQSLSVLNADTTLIRSDGSVDTVDNSDSTMYRDGDVLLNYFSSDWTKVLEEGTYTELAGGKQKIVGRIDDADYIIVRNEDGTFSDVTTEMRVPGGWTLKTVCHFDEWTTDSTVLLPGKMDWRTFMVISDREVLLVDSYIRLLSLDNKDFIREKTGGK